MRTCMFTLNKKYHAREANLIKYRNNLHSAFSAEAVCFGIDTRK